MSHELLVWVDNADQFIRINLEIVKIKFIFRFLNFLLKTLICIRENLDENCDLQLDIDCT